MLADIWPIAGRDRARSSRGSIDPELFRETYASVFEGDERWRALPIPSGDRYAWDPTSTYIARPPFFEGLTAEPAPLTDIDGARVLALLGDSVTTDHISPAGLDRRLVARRRVAPGARRRAARVQLVRRPPRPPRGDDARHLRQHPAAQPAGRRTRGPVHAPPARTARRRSSTTPRCATATRACRCSSSPAASTAPARRATGRPRARRCSASGRCIAESYERIHRSNLVGMGVLPLQFLPGESAGSLGLTGREAYTIHGLADPRAAPGGDGGRADRRRTAPSGASGPSPASTARSRSSTCARAGSCRRCCGGSPAS